MSNSSFSSSCSGLPGPQSRISLADFELLKLIGKGHAGSVYLARDRLSHEPVAMKVVQKGQGHDSRTLLEQELQRESSGCSFLLPLWASWHDENNFYLVRRYLGGSDMGTNLAAKTRFPEEQARFYTAEMLVALEEMKMHMILHRDLKPSNIVFTSSGHVRVIDFGFATRLKTSPVTHVNFLADPNAQSGYFKINDPDYTSTEQVGTPSFMSPDVHLGRPYSFEADLHALGVTLYKMLTGRLPFGEGAKSHDEILEAVLCEQLTFRPTDCVSPEARDLLSHLLRRDSKKPARLEDIMYHPWFSQIQWDKVRTQATSPRWKLHSTPLPKSTIVSTVAEGLACLPDPYPDFTYISSELLSLRSRGERNIWKKIGAFFTSDQSPTTTPPASPVLSAASDIDYKVSMPSPPPDIPLPPLPAYKTAEPTLFELLSCPSPTQTHSPGAGGVLPPLSIRQKLIERAPPPVKARPIRGDITRMPEVTITPADPEDKVEEAEASRSPRLSFKEIPNQRLLSPIDAERPIFTSTAVKFVGPPIKLSAPPKRRRRAEKENLGADVANTPIQTRQKKPEIQPKPSVPSKPTAVPMPVAAPVPPVTPVPPVAPIPMISSRSMNARSPPTAVFMIPPKVVPLPIFSPDPLPSRTPPKSKLKTTSSPLKATSSSPKATSSPPKAISPPKAKPKATSKPPSKISSPKSTSPKIKPAFKVPSKVPDSRFKEQQATVRRRISRTPASPSSSPFANTREGVYPRAMVQDEFLSHPALAFVDMKERPEDYPRPPHVKSAPMEQLSVDDTLSLSPASPLGQETQENAVPIDFPQVCIKDTQVDSFSAHVSAPLVTTGPRSSGQLIGPPLNDWHKLFARFSTALRCLISWVRRRGKPAASCC